MGRLSRWLAVLLLTLSPALPTRAADAPPQPSADALIEGVIAQENRFEAARSLYLRFESKVMRSPEAIARNLAEHKKRYPDVAVDARRQTDLWSEMTEVLEYAFDQQRVRWLDFQADSYRNETVFDGRRAISHGESLNPATAYQESYALDQSPQRFFRDAFVDLAWLRVGVHSFWFSEPLTAQQIATRHRQIKSFTLAGQADFRGRRCFVLENVELHQRLHVGVDDRRWYGLTDMRLPEGVNQMPAINKAARRQFTSTADWEQWLDDLPTDERIEQTERFLAEQFGLMQPDTVMYLDDYRELAPGFWFPATQGCGWASGESSRELHLVDAKVNQPLDDRLFEIRLKDGVETTDWTYEPTLQYVYKADRTPDEWQQILGEHRRRSDQWKAEIAARDAWIGRPAPELPSGAWLNSEPLTLASLRGKVVVLDFWSTTCGGCRGDLLDLESSYKSARDAGVIFIGVHGAEDEKSVVENFAKLMGLSYPIVIDDALPEEVVGFGRLSGELGVRTIPYAFVIDENGKIAAHGQFGQTLETAYARAKQLKKSASRRNSTED